MGDYVYSVWIDASPAQVWDVYVDPRRIPEWQTGKPVIEEVLGEPGEPGATYVSRRGPLVARTRVLTAAAPAHLESETDAYLGMRFRVTSRLTERNGGTQLELTAETQWPRGRRLLGKLVDRVVLSKREADKEFRNLRELVERDAAG
jgi:uncharacterized protein YndB with AHSA1/START domain